MDRKLQALRLLVILSLATSSFVGAYEYHDATDVTPGDGNEQDLSLEYLYRYHCQPGSDHLLTALATGPDRAIVAGNQGLALLDLNALPPGGTQDYLYRLTGVNARNLYLKDNYVFVNLNRAGSGGSYGFTVVRIDGDSLTDVTTVDEPDVFYEKMDVSGDYLYVAAHDEGIRIFDISNPESPVLVGSLQDGFLDAFAVVVAGTAAYVADGGGGLKIVDVTDPASPFLLDGEDLDSTVGTAEAVTVDATNNVYVAGGSAGVLIYSQGNPDAREIVPIGGTAEDFAWVGNYLAVTTFNGLVVLEPDGVGGATVVAEEISARRGTNARLRLAGGLGSADDDRILVANWNYMDVYQLKAAGQSTQPDINSTAQRLRFPPAGGTYTVTLTNRGQGDLVVSGVTSTVPSFWAGYSGGTILPGESVSFPITYNGSPTQGSGKIGVFSNDPDENPLPIQLFGNTAYLDPGEAAIDFSLPILHRDPDTGDWLEGTFTLSEHLGQVVWFQIYGSW